MAIEKRSYETLTVDGDFEVRAYDAAIVAETIVEAPFERAGNEAFGRLAGYIFGKNRADQKIAMTAPVTQESPRSEKIAMTAPVTQEAAGDASSRDAWRFTFTMPSEYTLADLPTPEDDRVRVREEPGGWYASVRYSGTWSRKRYEARLASLRTWMDSEGLAPTGSPVWARYDPPFMPWFLRTNEVLIPIDEP